MPIYVFGEHELDADGFALRCGEVELPLQPKVFDVLRYLVEHRGRVVTKTELLDRLWPNEYVNEAVVAWSISHIRRAFGQERAAKTPIETIHGRGYRFTASVTERVGPRRTPSVKPSDAPFVGREPVLAELANRLDAALTARGSISVLSGEAGIGKTRCSEELVKRAEALGMRTLIARAPEAEGSPPLWPLGRVLRGVADDEVEPARRAIAQLAQGEGERAPDAGLRFVAVERLAEALLALARKQPTLLVLDDVQWADNTTLEWLAFVASELASSPLCILLTLRTDESEPGSTRERLLRRVLRHATALSLGSLDGAQVGELMAAVHQEQPSPELSEAVRRASGGVPLYVLAVVRTLARDRERIGREALQPDAVRVPELARDILSQRIAHLPRPTLEVVAKAAVIGESFDLSLLASLVELEPEALLDRLAPALAEGQVVSDAPHVYRFAHGLFRSVVYDQLPPRPRAEAHRTIGQLLKARPRDQVQPSEIARHYYLSLPAGHAEEVTAIAREAGLDALRRVAFDEAELCFGWALEAQLFGEAPAPAARAELLSWLASAQRSGGRTGAAMQTATRVIEFGLSHELDLAVVGAVRTRRPTIAFAQFPDDFARSALEQVLKRRPEGADRIRISALAQLACIPPYEPDLATAKRLTAQAVSLAEQLGDREPLFEALRARLYALSGPNDVSELLAVSERMIELDRAGEHSWQTNDARIARVGAHLLTGQIAQAHAVLEDAAQAAGSGWGEALFYVRRFQAQRPFLEGNFEEGEALWRKAYEQAARAGVSYADALRCSQQMLFASEREGPAVCLERHVRPLTSGRGIARSTRAVFLRIAASAGSVELAREQLALLGDLDALPRVTGYLHTLASIAVAAVALGDRALCDRALRALAPYADFNTPDALGFYLGSAAHFLGLLAHALGRADEARAYFKQALASNRAMGYRAGVVRTLLASGQLERQAGDDARARARFEAAHTDAIALGMAGETAEASRALDSLSMARP